MKLSENTLLVLQQCAKFNQHLVVQSGHEISSINIQKNRLMVATVEDEFSEFAIHNLSGFLKQLMLFDQPEITFNKDQMIITDSEAKSTYRYSNKEDLCYLDRKLGKLETAYEFSLSASALDKVIRASAANATEDIALVGENGNCYIKALDKAKPNRIFSVNLGKTKDNFCVYLKHERKNKLQLFNTDYKVRITQSGIVIFETDPNEEQENLKVTFYIASER